MAGLAQGVVLPGGNLYRDKTPSGVYGLVVSRSFPDFDFVAETVTRLQTKITQPPGGLPHGEHPYDYGYEPPVWACAANDTLARSLLQDPILLPLVASWKLPGQDLRRLWRDSELLLLCDAVYVFQKAGAKTQWSTWRDRGVYKGLTLIESPAAVKRARGTRQGDSGNRPSLRQ